MGVYIKGMEMPTRCFSCPMCDVENAEVNCAVSHGSYIDYREVDPKVAIQERPDWCPLGEVQPHGRLIDADALEKKFCSHCDDYMSGFDECKEGCFDLKIIKNMPTIIPADKDGDNNG